MTSRLISILLSIAIVAGAWVYIWWVFALFITLVIAFLWVLYIGDVTKMHSRSRNQEENH